MIRPLLLLLLFGTGFSTFAQNAVRVLTLEDAVAGLGWLPSSPCSWSGLLRDFCLGSEVDYVGRNGQRKAVGFCRVSNPLRSKTLLSHGLAPPKFTVSDSLKLFGGRHDQILRTIIPRTSLHCRYFRVSAGTSDRTFVFAWLGASPSLWPSS